MGLQVRAKETAEQAMSALAEIEEVIDKSAYKKLDAWRTKMKDDKPAHGWVRNQDMPNVSMLKTEEGLSAQPKHMHDGLEKIWGPVLNRPIEHDRRTPLRTEDVTGIKQHIASQFDGSSFRYSGLEVR